jgi:23S rRNA (cytidine1920-2'-O)/16S rRNA (cytidine1409-2'-O)-methyltransferase
LDSLERLDKILVIKGLFESRSKAEQAILSRKVKVDSKVIDKPGKKILQDSKIELDSNEPNYVSRGALKLIKALDSFQIDVSNLTCIDLGASTGGFTQVLLERNCSKVYCIDVGTGQLHPRISSEKRVINYEKTHVKDLSAQHISEPIDLIVIDVSFISLTKVLQFLPPFLKNQANIIALIKPQFEVGKRNLSKGGIVKDEKIYPSVISDIKNYVDYINLEWLAHIESPISGGDGNKEFLCHLRKSSGMDV